MMMDSSMCGCSLVDVLAADEKDTYKEFPPIENELEELIDDEPYSILYSPCSKNLLEEDRESRIQYFPDCTSSDRPQLAPSSGSLTEEDTPNLLEDSIFEILSQQNSYDEAENLVLKPYIMEGMQPHFPLSKKGESFWLQYSLVRDGASMDCLLFKTRNTEHSVLAIETVDGEIFGAYTSHRWQVSHDFYGSRETFLWRINDSKGLDNLEIFNFSYLNNDIQLCTQDRLVVGGGIKAPDPSYGFGINLDKDLLTGTTNKCLAFSSPPLSKIHANGSSFEVRNIEIWALTPCLSLKDAEQLRNELRAKKS
jgi:hypothetical protein